MGREDLIGLLCPRWDQLLDSQDILASGKAALRSEALMHWLDRIEQRDSDWGQILARLRITRLEGEAKEGGLDIRAMEATVAGRAGPYRKGDELIDRLIRLPSSRVRGAIGLPPVFIDEERDPHGACRPLREGGFVAIAAMVRGLDDKRLTRRNLWRVDQACSELLEDIIGRDTVAAWKVHPAAGEVLPKKKVQAWWGKARKLSEEDYYSRSVLTLNKGENSKHHLQFLARKYPKALLPLYRKLLRDYPVRDGADLLAGMMNSKLPNKTKGEAILAGIVEGNRRQRRAALRQLGNLVPDDLRQLLLLPFAAAGMK
jgi:hypothetical protein